MITRYTIDQTLLKLGSNVHELRKTCLLLSFHYHQQAIQQSSDHTVLTMAAKNHSAEYARGVV